MNVLILMGDQHRYDALGCATQGIAPHERTWLMDGGVRTPHLDRLAATGTRFHQAIANLPVCVPCRHSFITGLYPHQTGILTNAHYWPDQPPVPTLAHVLRDAGYATAAIGKMHWKHRNAPEHHVPDKRGFEFRAGRGVNTDGPVDVIVKPRDEERSRRVQAEYAERFGTGGESREGYVGDVSPVPAADLPEALLTDEAVRYLQTHKRERSAPFCLLVSLVRPHPPNVVPPEYAHLYPPESVPLPPAVPDGFVEDDPHVRRQIGARGWGQMDERELRLSISRYLGNVTYVDDCLGRVLTALDELGYADDTLVVLLSDHGDLLGERRRPGQGGGHTKYSLYDAAERVPLIVRWPGLGTGGAVSHAAVELVDLMPTWLDAAGIDAPVYLPGRSLRPLLEGQTPEACGWREATLAEQYTPATEHPEAGGPRGQWAYRERRWKLIERAGARSAFYDLESDPYELENLIDDPSLAAVRERLRQRLLRDVIARAERYPARHDGQVAIAR
ncbi:MAG TPA: sulfatase-like hydrolase/transferase [Chloroflexota bacterium]|nr:sulfatase-like hydrolase/transferase [Chloroflexota bacterium]